MRLTSIKASNFLSFGPEPNGIELELLSPKLNVIVGPNGAGKSNAFRVVKSILDKLKATAAQRATLPRACTYYHRYGEDLEEKVVRLSVGIAFDTAEEKRLLTTFWKSALVYQSDLKQGLPIRNDGGVQYPTQIKDDRLASYERQISKIVTEQSLGQIFQGELILESYRREPYLDSVIFIFEVNGEAWQVYLQGPLPGCVGRKGLEANGWDALSSAYAQSLHPDIHENVALFLNGNDVTFPELPQFNLQFLEMSQRKHPSLLNTKVDMRGHRFPQLLLDLNDMLGRFPTNGNAIGLEDILSHLFCEATICQERWEINEEDDLDAYADAPDSDLLSQGHLALYLFRLKNNWDEDKRQLFGKIAETFRSFCGVTVDAIVSNVQNTTVTTPKPETLTSMKVALVTDKDIALSLSGSGRGQLALLSALVHQGAGKALLLDEPDKHLHQTLRAEVAARLDESEAQTIVVSNSPYMIPHGKLERVRRIYFAPDTSFSRVSSPVGGSQGKDRRSSGKRAMRPDENLFLFSRCTVFVEGPHEAAALPVWFDKWMKRQRAGEGAGERLGVRFQAAEGSNGVSPLMNTARTFGVEYVGLFDADVFRSRKRRECPQCGGALKDGDTGNKNVLDQWRKFGLLNDGVDLALDDKSCIDLFPGCSKEGRIFLCGKKIDDSFEGLEVFQNNWDKALDNVGKGTPAYRWIAEQTDPPDIFEALFNRVKELAERGSGGLVEITPQ